MTSLTKWASPILLTAIAAAESILLSLEDANYRPTEFRDGLPTYLSLKRDDSLVETDMGQFLLCTSCTVSYVFASSAGETIVASEYMTFTEGAEQVQVDFVEVTLLVDGYAADDEDTDPAEYSWTMQLGFIDPSYATSSNFPYES